MKCQESCADGRNHKDDPFEDLVNSKDFLRKSNRARPTLEQIASYASSQMGSRIMCDCSSGCSVSHTCIFCFSSRLDSCGGTALWLLSASSYRLDMPVLTDFFWRFNNADAKHRDHDLTVAPFNFTTDLTKFDQFQFAASPGDVKIEDVNFFEMLLPPGNRRYVKDHLFRGSLSCVSSL
jgi:hypothetical protein